MLALRPRPFPVSAHSSHLRTSHRSRFLSLPASWGKASDIGGNLPFGRGGGGVGGHDVNLSFGENRGDIGGNVGGHDVNLPFGENGGDGGGGGNIGGGGDINNDGGDEDDTPIEGFPVLGGILQWLRHLLPLGALKEHLTMNCWINISTKDNVECQSSSSMLAINPVGDEASSCDGKNDEEHALDPIVLNSTTNSRSNYSMRMREIHYVDIGNSDEGNDSDGNEKKMKGRHGFVYNTANASLVCSGFLVAYWTVFCSHANFGIWKDIIPTTHIAMTIISLILIGPASSFKEGELPDNLEFKFLQIMQLLILLWLWAASFTTLRVCRDISKSVVWPVACAVLFMIVFTWINYFQPAKMVIKSIKTMSQEMTQWLKNLSLPECITSKFKKVRGMQRGPIQDMEMV